MFTAGWNPVSVTESFRTEGNNIQYPILTVQGFTRKGLWACVYPHARTFYFWNCTCVFCCTSQQQQEIGELTTLPSAKQSGVETFIRSEVDQVLFQRWLQKSDFLRLYFTKQHISKLTRLSFFLSCTIDHGRKIDISTCVVEGIGKMLGGLSCFQKWRCCI